MTQNRRGFLKSTAASLTALSAFSLNARFSLAGSLSVAPEALPEGARLSAELFALPGKLPLIKKTWRPPNFETPLSYFDEAFTPNEAFFVRYHHSAIPEVDSGKWALQIGGEVSQSLHFSLDDLKREFAHVEIAALCVCAGNRRGLMQPHVPGIQWGHGAMGNARWKGVRLRDVLNRAGLGGKAIEVAFDGADKGALEKTADLVKSLPVSKAMDENTLIAFEMNGKPLPPVNGFPARLVVPGWAASYWVKHLTGIIALTTPLDGYWMKKSYRIPKGLFTEAERFASQETGDSVTVTDLPVNSLILHPAEGTMVNRSQNVDVRGLAWDGGHGIDRLEVSLDQGRTWNTATLGEDLGRFSWRAWQFVFQPRTEGAVSILARATNREGLTQPMEPKLNPHGYNHNAVQKLLLRVV